MRYIKRSKKSKILKIEKEAFTKTGFCTSIFGEVDCAIPDFNYREEITTMTTIRYYKKQYTLLVKYKAKTQNNNENKGIISLDPGIRTLFTGYANTKIVEIGKTSASIISKRLEKIDLIKNNKNMTIPQKKKITNKIYDKIKNKIIDFHWKTINYLTDNFSTILIGNFSTKSMGKGNSVNKMIKRIGNMIRLNDFKEKLKYKCKYKNCFYKLVDEAYTTKCCSKCSNFKKELTTEKIYNCHKCNLITGRDLNAAKNILINAL